MTFLLGILGPKLFGVLLEKGIQAFQAFLARKDLKDKVRQEGKIAMLKLANRALEYKSSGDVPPDVVQPGAGNVGIRPEDAPPDR